MSKFLSRKFIVTALVMLLLPTVPVIFKKSEVDDSVTLMVLGIIGSIATAYGILNVREAKLDSKPREPNE